MAEDRAAPLTGTEQGQRMYRVEEMAAASMARVEGRVVLAGPGTTMFIPTGAAMSFNGTSLPINGSNGNRIISGDVQVIQGYSRT